MAVKDLVKQFKAAAWTSAEEAQAFCLEAGTLPAGEVVKLLEVLLNPGRVDSAAQHNRALIFTRIVEQSATEELFVPFLRALKPADPVVRNVLAPLLVRVNNVAAHPELCALVRSPDPDLRKLASHVLRQVAGRTAFEVLTEMVREQDMPGRLEAADILVNKGAYHAIPALASILQLSSKPMEKVQVLKYLGDPRAMAKDTPGALRAIALALRDTDERVAIAGIGAFTAHCSEDEYFQHVAPCLESGSLNLVRASLDGLRRFDSERSLALLEKAFRAGPNSVRLAVLASLEAMASDATIPLLVQALHSTNVNIRQRGADILSGLATSKKLDLARTILWLLRSRDVNVRRLAVEIVKKVGDPTGELGPKLLRFLRDEDWWVRERVTDALVEMSGTQLTRYIVQYLQDPSDIVRRYAVDVLMRLADPASLGALVRTATTDTDWWVRERSIEAIGLLKDPRAIPYVMDLLGREPELRLACLGALVSLKAQQAAPHVAALLADADAEMRLELLVTLGTIGTPEQAPLVVDCMSDADHRVRVRARELISRWNVSLRQTFDVAAEKGLSLLDRLLVGLAKAEGDDLILASGTKPFIKRLGQTTPLANNVFSGEQVEAMLLPHLSEAQRRALGELKDVDFSYEIKTEGLRFRANVFRQLSGLSAVFRIVKAHLPRIEDLGLPPIVQALGDTKNGLVLVGGPTGSGKSTTLAGIIDYVNRTHARHIITLEDPIEVLHGCKKCLVNQREIGSHTLSFDAALRSTLREDPDVILVGEMRDLPTIQFAVTAAETGHLVLGTLHTVSADTSVDRLISAFPPGQQDQVRAMLAETLRAVVCQHLFRRKDGPGRVLAVEVMLNNDAVSNLVRKAKTFQIPSVIATSREQGMQSMDSEILRLLREGKIHADEAYMKAVDKKAFEAAVGMDGGAREAVRPLTNRW